MEPDPQNPDVSNPAEDDQVSVEMELSCSDGEQNQEDSRDPVRSELSEASFKPSPPPSDHNSDSNADSTNKYGRKPILQEDEKKTNIIQVLNVSPFADKQRLQTLFKFLGFITNIELYDMGSEANFQVCFVEYVDPQSVLLARYLTNTVFIDRALVVLPYNKLKIPDIAAARAEISTSKAVSQYNSGFAHQLIAGPSRSQMIATHDPKLNALKLSYPQLPISTDPSKLEEIRRTVYIGNLDSTVTPDEVMKFFDDIGEVKYIRMAGDDSQPTRFAFVEYTHQTSIANALQHNGELLGSRSLKINHSNNAIVKPPSKWELIDIEAARISAELRSEARDGKYRSRSHRDRNRDRLRDRDRSDRYASGRKSSPRDSKSHRSSVSRDRDIEPRRHRSKSRERTSRRSRSKDKSSRRRSRSRESKRKRSRSKEGSRGSRRRKSNRR